MSCSELWPSWSIVCTSSTLSPDSTKYHSPSTVLSNDVCASFNPLLKEKSTSEPEAESLAHYNFLLRTINHFLWNCKMNNLSLSKMMMWTELRHMTNSMWDVGYSFLRLHGSLVVPACWAGQVLPPWTSSWWPHWASLLYAYASRPSGSWGRKHWVTAGFIFKSIAQLNSQCLKMKILTSSPIPCSMCRRKQYMVTQKATFIGG